MRTSRIRALAAIVLVAGATAAPAAARAASPEITMSRTHVSTSIGDEFRFTSVIANSGSTPVSGLVAHLDIVSWDRDVYVDPEDWSSERTRYLPALAPGRSVEVPWTVKAVNSGHLAVYVTVLGAGRPVTGPELDARVASRATIDAGGALPLALGVPALLGLAAIAVRGGRRRRAAVSEAA
jgi:hypothetical protein